MVGLLCGQELRPIAPLEGWYPAIYPPPRTGQAEVVAWEDIRWRALEDGEIRRDAREFGDQLDACGTGANDSHFQIREGAGGVPASGV